MYKQRLVPLTLFSYALSEPLKWVDPSVLCFNGRSSEVPEGPRFLLQEHGCPAEAEETIACDFVIFPAHGGGPDGWIAEKTVVQECNGHSHRNTALSAKEISPAIVFLQ